ncbi:MAG: polyribonucleotide nucleotidyltransferase [Oscillospiraceae bacterium]|nr:polyribonucleotide nucleotidyltransferase [Oscillospiraceae bacterium]
MNEFFQDFKQFETTVGGRPLVVEIGKMAQLAGGACMVRYGETDVLCTATMSAKPRDGIDFFPLSVDFEEKLYSVGKIPGSFQRREGRASEKAVLASRVIDRPIRPLFPKDMRNDVSVVATVMSVDQDCPPDMAAMLGVSIALSISEIPWRGPIAGVCVGLTDGGYVINPTAAEREASRMSVVVASTAELVAMIEAGAQEVTNDEMFEGIMFAHAENQRLVGFIQSIAEACGKRKIAFPSNDPAPEMYEAVKSFALEEIRKALDTDDKRVRDERLKPIYQAVHEKFDGIYPEETAKLDDCLYKTQKYAVRRWLLDDGKRVDGRGIDEIRPLNAQIDLLARAHGSGMFTRGQTQVLTVTTLASNSMSQLLDGIDEEDHKRYIHHYNFPSFSVGETRPARGPGRREIGHGALAERALLPMIPSIEEFPYAIRLVSEVLSSNGSTSQGAICASTLSLMAAGVPLKAPVAGISCGLVTEGERFMTMVDIQGVEDFFGDMDFKVAGTHNGITAIQMDLKIDGLTPAIIREALEKTYKARLYILDNVMLPVIGKPREELSKYAPKMLTTTIPVEKISEVIGKQGKVIQKICAECNCKIDVEEDGKIFICAVDIEDAKRALFMVETIAHDPEVGSFYKGVVTRLMEFGAFVEIAPGKEGLVHISHLDIKRTERVEDVVAVGDEVVVKVREIDDQGRLNLSRRAAMIELDGMKPENTVSDAPRRPAPRSDDRRGGFDRNRGGNNRR